jgi:hypothetical protein
MTETKKKKIIFQPYIYCVGVIGTGVTMSLLPYATTAGSIYAVCAVSGVFSACFIGIWNSLIKVICENKT